MNLKINRWRGGLGNNIMQIRNAIQVALYYDYNMHDYDRIMRGVCEESGRNMKGL